MAASDGNGEITCANHLLSKGFVQVPILVLQDQTLGAGAKLTYGILLWYHWKGDGYPGHYEAAAMFGIGRASLCRYLTELEDRGLVEKKQGFQGNFNTYHLPDPNLILRPQESQNEILGISKWDSHKVQDSLALDSDSESESGDTQEVPTSAPQVAGVKSDSDFADFCEATATALGRPREGKQLATWARKHGIPADTLRIALERTQERHQEETLTKPVAYLQTVAAQIALGQRLVAEAKQQTQAEAWSSWKAYARSTYADGAFMGRTWQQVQRILEASFGAETAAALVRECELEAPANT